MYVLRVPWVYTTIPRHFGWCSSNYKVRCKTNTDVSEVNHLIIPRTLTAFKEAKGEWKQSESLRKFHWLRWCIGRSHHRGSKPATSNINKPKVQEYKYKLTNELLDLAYKMGGSWKLLIFRFNYKSKKWCLSRRGEVTPMTLMRYCRCD